MRVLLDTHTLIWWDSALDKLPVRVQRVLYDSDTTVYVNLASAWEMQIKAQLGKLQEAKPWLTILQDQINHNGFRLLHPELSHIQQLDHLPFHHKDPFDRLLIAQAIVEDLTLVSRDPKFTPYPAHLFW